MNILEVHRKVKDNVGDAYCNPSRYFEFEDLVTADISSSNLDVRDKNLIIGGGGLIHKGFQKNIQLLLGQSPKHSVLWGIGHNFGRKHITKSKTNVYYPSWIYKTSLVGIRDWIPGYEKFYLPCVSCMHTAFDKQYEVKHNVAYFVHSFKTSFIPNPDDIVLGNKQIDFENTIKFLGEANTIVTDSYHGAYWAQLLGKRVMTTSWSVKFDHFKYPPTQISRLEKWKDYCIPNYPSDNYLEESRSLNINFYNKVLDVFNS